MNKIPQIIHQIWSGIDEPLPDYFKELGETWKRDYPTWKYEIWDDARMTSFVKKHYPQYWDVYNNYPYNIQRWDAIRYLILHELGGMYVDFDYESVQPMDLLIEDKTCCFALEPYSHCFLYRKRIMFNNALMLSIPKHPFMKKIIENVFDPKVLICDTLPKRTVIYDSQSNIISDYQINNKDNIVMNTTGPWILMDLYNNLSEKDKEDVFLIPAKNVTPFDGYQAGLFRTGCRDLDLEDCLKEAYAVHYFFSEWRRTES